MKPFVLLGVAALVALPARACLNDRDSDSLATQAAQLPTTLRVITGRFERNPPLYYQMRIARERANLQTNPRQFGLYDDIGVALDKLGRDDEALQTMKAKRALLPAFDPDDKANRENWYRYFANEGTFRAHRFLKAGAPKEKLGELEAARAQIKRAIEIKPNAHFGRERYQLMAMDWIIARKSGVTKKTLGEWIAGRDSWQELWPGVVDQNRKRAVEGLSGMIVLGGAWESPDMFEALAGALSPADTVTLRHLAILRAQELLLDGKPSLGGLTQRALVEALRENEGVGQKVSQKNYASLASLFGELRYEADNWSAARGYWLETQLKTGVHPDTYATFWKGYQETPPPSLKMSWFAIPTMQEVERDALQKFTIIVLSVGVLLLGIRLFVVSRRLKPA